MSTISSSEANREAEEEVISGLTSLYTSLGTFAGANLVDVLVDGPGKSGFSCFMDALVNNGNGELSQSPLTDCGNEDSNQKNKVNYMLDTTCSC